MSEEKWTPGPWIIGDESNSCVEACIGETEAIIDREPPRGGDLVISRDKMLANAHLIAAAPEMADYIKEKADSGCEKATALWRKCCGEI